jgi:hypothetical protein
VYGTAPLALRPTQGQPQHASAYSKMAHHVTNLLVASQFCPHWSQRVPQCHLTAVAVRKSRPCKSLDDEQPRRWHESRQPDNPRCDLSLPSGSRNPRQLGGGPVWLRARKAAAGSIPPPVHHDAVLRSWFACLARRADTELSLAERMGGEMAGILVLEGRRVDQHYIEPALAGLRIGSQLVKLAQRARPHHFPRGTLVDTTGGRRLIRPT